MYITNKSGKTGVNLKTTNGVDSWRATWVDGSGKRCEKSFSTTKYNNAFELACQYRDKMIETLNQEGFGYSYRHGDAQDSWKERG